MITKVFLGYDKRKVRGSPWTVRWFGEYDAATGRQRRYSKSFRLKREAERFRAGKQVEFDKGGQRDRPAMITLDEFCAKYQRQRKHEWSASTTRHVEQVCERLLDHFVPRTPLTLITPDRAVEFWSTAKKVRSGFEGDELSRSSRNWLLRYVKAMFQHAVSWGHVVQNPFVGIKAIRVAKRNRRSWHYVTPDDYRALLDVAPSLRWKVFYALAYTSGARFGELFNLMQGNLDFDDARLIIVNRNGTADLPPFHIKDHENRTVPLPAHAISIASEWCRTRPGGSPFLLLAPQRYERVLKRWRTCRASDMPWLNTYMVNNVIRDIRQHAKKAGLKLDGALTVHSFRKSCGQNWANHLPMNVVREFMGHADISTTAEFYSTVTSDHADHARWVIENLTMGQTDVKLTSERQINRNRRVG